MSAQMDAEFSRRENHLSCMTSQKASPQSLSRWPGWSSCHLTWWCPVHCGGMSKIVIVGSGIRTGLAANPGSANFFAHDLEQTLSLPQVSSSAT